MLSQIRASLSEARYRRAVLSNAAELLAGFGQPKMTRVFAQDAGISRAIEEHHRQGVSAWDGAAFCVAAFLTNKLAAIPAGQRAAADAVIREWQADATTGNQRNDADNVLAFGILTLVIHLVGLSKRGHLDENCKSIVISEVLGALRGYTAEERADGRLEGYLAEALNTSAQKTPGDTALPLASAYRAGERWVSEIDATFDQLMAGCRDTISEPRAAVAALLGWLTALQAQQKAIYEEADPEGEKVRNDWYIMATAYSQRFRAELLEPLFGADGIGRLPDIYIDLIASHLDLAVQRLKEEGRESMENALDDGVRALRAAAAAGTITLPTCSDDELREVVRTSWNDGLEIESLLANLDGSNT